MTEPQTEGEDRFPDVSTGIKTAGTVTALSVIAYASVFILLASRAHGSAAILMASLGLATALLALAYIDLRTGLLLDVINFPLIAAGIVWAVFAAPGTGVGWLHSVLGAALGYGLIAGLAYAWRRWRGYEGIGLGDAKLLAAGGAW
ncbi:MAG: A24 family peptidase, partial [Pseudomonadota bacterium]|nr:A24 family peptidase [Pseudomonadota bacterium]